MSQLFFWFTPSLHSVIINSSDRGQHQDQHRWDTAPRAGHRAGLRPGSERLPILCNVLYYTVLHGSVLYCVLYCTVLCQGGDGLPVPSQQAPAPRPRVQEPLQGQGRLRLEEGQLFWLYYYSFHPFPFCLILLSTTLPWLGTDKLQFKLRAYSLNGPITDLIA